MGRPHVIFHILSFGQAHGRLPYDWFALIFSGRIWSEVRRQRCPETISRQGGGVHRGRDWSLAEAAKESASAQVQAYESVSVAADEMVSAYGDEAHTQLAHQLLVRV